MLETKSHLLEKQFLIAIEESNDPLHKLAYADWLEEQTSMVLQARRLAYAYRWAAHRQKHPGRKDGFCVWRCSSHSDVTRKEFEEGYMLPWAVYQYLSHFSMNPDGDYYTTYLHLAFQSLADALNRLKKDLSLDGVGLE